VVAVDVARAVLSRLDGDVRAVAGDDAERTLARQALVEGNPEWAIPSAELPPDPPSPRGRVELEELEAAISADPGIGRAGLAELFDIGRDAIGSAAAALEAAGRVRSERQHGAFRYWPAAQAAEGAA
jgi:hypothetical protein